MLLNIWVASTTNDYVLFEFIDTLSGAKDAEHMVLPRNEVIFRLRERGEPILLFGESELDSFKRLRKCEISEPEVNKVCAYFIIIIAVLLQEILII